MRAVREGCMCRPCSVRGLGSLIHRYRRVWRSGSAVLAALLSPGPVIRTPLDALEPEPVVVGVAIRAGPDAHDVARTKRLGGDAFAFETRHAGPFRGVGLPSAE